MQSNSTINWENFCKQFSYILLKDEFLSSIMTELYLSGPRSYLKVIGNLSLVIVKLFYFQLKKGIRPLHSYYQNIYFIDSSSPSDIGNIVPLIEKDKKTFLVIVNSEVEISNAFSVIKDKVEYINYEKHILLDARYFLRIFSTSLLISRKMSCNYLNAFNLVLRYFSIRGALNRVLSFIEARNIFLSNHVLLPSNLAIHIAKRNGIQDYIIQQGFLTHLFIPLTGNNFIIWGNKAKEWLESKNVKANFLPLGSPRLDAIIAIKAEANSLKQKFYEKYQIDTSKNIFLYLSHSQAPEFEEELHLKNLEALIKVTENNNYQLVIKLHPAESPSLFNKVFRRHKDKVILLPKKSNIHHSIISSKLCASAFSTSLIESMCLGIPTFQMNIARLDDLPDYSINEGCIPIQETLDLTRILGYKDFSKQLKRQKKYVELYLNNLGKASDAIHKYISKE